jgi:exodeoxyribonuclease-5
MQLSAKQDEAIRAVNYWYKKEPDKQVFKLMGWAGTGKTTLAQHFADTCGGQVGFAAYTGKAAYVLQQKGARGATTIHSLIYKPVEGSIPVRFTLNIEESPLTDMDLLIVDEVSMVDEKIAEDLLSFGVKILVLGDPFQLPPIKGQGYFTTGHPDFLLDEIHRQAQDNPIIALSMKVREKRPIPIGKYGESEVKYRMTGGDAIDADMVLVGLNRTRRRVNQALRMQELGEDLPDYPVYGDMLVCLRNNHPMGLLNGSIWKVVKVLTPDPALDEEQGYLYYNLADEDEESLYRVKVHPQPFLNQEIDPYKERYANQFDYGYALTCHKAQGSQWPHVTIADESRVFGPDRWRWLYTAITRASEKITLCMRG